MKIRSVGDQFSMQTDRHAASNRFSRFRERP